MSQIEEERALLKRATAGDVAAFEPIVACYQQRAYQYALSILRNHHDALDLSQGAAELLAYGTAVKLSDE